MQLTTLPMPGALRLRALHPLIDGDGSCSLIYDLERAAVVEVPEELQFHVAPALETGDLDEDLVGWLAGEDLLTSEGWNGWREEPEAVGTLEAAGWWSLGAIYRVDDTIHARIGQPDEEAVLPALEHVFKHSLGTGKVKLHLDWGGDFPGRSLLKTIVVESRRLAAPGFQEVSSELSLDASEVTPAIASFLAGLPIHVRLRCGSFPGSDELIRLGGRVEAWRAEPAVRLLVDRMAERLTVCCVLDGARLLDLWGWAKRTGVKYLDAVRLEDAVFTGKPQPARVREYRNDLLAVCDEMAGELEAQRFPVDYKPLSRIVGRLRRSEPLDLLPGGGWSSGLPFDVPGLGSGLMPDFWKGFPEEAEPAAFQEESEPSCRGCWARHICNQSSFAASGFEGDDPQEPSEERCALWKTEVEVALRFYHRLAHTDPIQVLRFFEESSREPVTAPIGRREDLGYLKVPF
ncbi:MAG TPA: hypothetical protein VJ725_16925 [Thermoanaerobaculia bacterium]|nr:hypothetical protein [Thermoanaerobaculia bacterium]